MIDVNLMSLFCDVNLMDHNLVLPSHPSPDFSDLFLLCGWFDVLQRALHEAFEVISQDPEGKPKSRWGKLHYLLWKMWCHVPTAQQSSAQRQLKQMGGRTHLNWFHIIRFTNTLSSCRKQSPSSLCRSETRLLSTETKLRRAEVDNNRWLSAIVAPIFKFLVTLNCWHLFVVLFAICVGSDEKILKSTKYISYFFLMNPRRLMWQCFPPRERLIFTVNSTPSPS